MADDEEEDENVSIGVSRYPCMPSLVALQQMRNRLHLAHLGRKLMKWTSLATSKELRRIGHEYIIASKNYGENIRDAYILLARCRYFYPNLNKMVTEDVLRYPNEAIVSVQTSYKYVTGIMECRLEVYRSDDPPYLHLGVDKGGELIAEAKRVWFELLQLMVLILELKLDFEMAEASHKGATKKANVLSKIIIPKITKSIIYILSELEEKEREEIFRLKRVKQKKEKAKSRMINELRGRLSIREEPVSVYELLPKEPIIIEEVESETETNTELEKKTEDEPIEKISCNCFSRKRADLATKASQTISQIPSSELIVQKGRKDDSYKQKEPCEIEAGIFEHEARTLNSSQSSADTDGDIEPCPICEDCTPDQISCRSVYFDAVDDMIPDKEDYHKPVRVAIKGTGSKSSKCVRFENKQTQTCCSKSEIPYQRISQSCFKRYFRANKFKSSIFPADSLKSCRSGSQPAFIRVPIEKPVTRTKSLPLRTKSVGKNKSLQINRTNSANNSSCSPDCAGRISNHNISRKKVRINKQTQATCDRDCGKIRMIHAASDTDYDDLRICDSCEPCMVHNYDEIDEI